ncbi:MAG TPA: type II toxin-antitoxin system HicB family antitoxin [Methanothrix sp.]|nr:type II toxin-antitoxin system HicB family antitoxin [Methanothrix sp.]
MQTFTAVIHREEEMFIAECPEVGTASQGTTIEEAIANIKEATQLYLEEFPINSKPMRSFITTFEVAEIART